MDIYNSMHVEGQIKEVGSLFPPCGSWRSGLAGGGHFYLQTYLNQPHT